MQTATLTESDPAASIAPVAPAAPPVDDELTPEQQEEINYRQPRVGVGELVVFYPDGTGKGRGIPVTVDHVHTRVIDTIRVGGTRKDQSVRHVSDPKLRLGASMRENGCWDWTERSKAQMRQLDAMSESIQKLEKRLDAVTKECGAVKAKLAELLPGAEETDKKKKG